MSPDARAHFYERIADRFEGLDHPADVGRRLAVVFDECLGDTPLHGLRVLDAGCGYGLFSAAAMRRGARVLSADIGPRLVARAVGRAGSHGVATDACALALRDEIFDVVISTEMLEHTHAPLTVLRELARVLRANGLLVLTTPNRAWQGVVRAASRLRLRPFHGLEQFVSWATLERACVEAGLDVVAHRGFHPWPFQLGLADAARAVEARLARASVARLMVNQVVVARKRDRARR